MIRQLRCGVLLASACAIVVAQGVGCGSPSATTSTAEATVHGTVKLKGKLITSGKVSFNPANINRKDAPVATAEISKDGTYTVNTLVGGNMVSVTAPETAKDPLLQYNRVQHNVTAGENSYDIEVVPP
jgi:hypothetical protein